MPLIRVGSRRVHIQELGSAGPLVVLVHPLGDTLSLWYFTVAPLLARSFRVLMYDLKGHGRSEFVAEEYGLSALAADLRDLLRERLGDEPRPVRVAGHSSGATLALRFGLEHPEWTHSLAIVDAPMPPFRIRDNPALEDRDPDEVRATFPSEELEVKRGSRRHALRINRKVRLMEKTSFPEDFEAEPGFTDRLATLDRPTLLLYGDQSPFLDVGREVARTMPAARLALVPGGHLIPITRRQEVAERMTEFLT